MLRCTQCVHAQVHSARPCSGALSASLLLVHSHSVHCVRQKALGGWPMQVLVVAVLLHAMVLLHAKYGAAACHGAAAC